MTSTESTIAPGFHFRSVRHLVAYGFGAGLSPWAPGTVGTLIAVPLYLVLSFLPVTLYLIVLAALIGVAVWACGSAARDLGEQDPPQVVGDEIVGFLLAMAAAPAGLIWVVAGFVLFRLFDIYKPWPVSAVDGRMGGGLGIVLDDLVAGAMTWVALWSLSEMVTASLRYAHH